MEQNKYDFTNVAVRCGTWEQMEELGKIAKGMGAKPYIMSKSFFPQCPYFAAYTDPSKVEPFIYTNIMTVPENYTIIPYATFISNPVKQ